MRYLQTAALVLALGMGGCKKVATCPDMTHTANGYCNVFGHPAMSWAGSDQANDLLPYLFIAQIVMVAALVLLRIFIAMKKRGKP